MIRLLALGNEAKQEVTILLNNSERVVFNFEYKPNQLGWFFSFTYNNNTYSNMRLTTSYNILRAYSSWLPFGLRCDTNDNEEPMDIDDFVTEYAKVYVVLQNEFDAIEGTYYAKV